MKLTRILFTAWLCILLAGTVWASAFPARMGQSEDGFVMVEFAGRQDPRKTQTPVASLPEPDAYLIRQGILLPDRNSYTKAMEDFCS